jgi:hypothetical protein
VARGIIASVLVVFVVSLGCSEGGDPARSGCDDVAGVWDLSRVSQTGTGITCPEANLVWTITQTGCDVAVTSAAWDAANGATGALSGSRLYLEWSWLQDCYRYAESMDVTVSGDTMSGEYYLVRGQAVYPAYCPGLGMCSASLSGVRRAP